MSKDEWVVFSLGGLIVTIYLFTTFLLVHHRPLYLELMVEGSIYETIGAIACLAAAFTFFITFVKYPPSNRLFPLKRNPFVLIIALGSLFLFLEEISWGQAWFEIKTLEWFANNNAQREISLHNIIGVHYLANPVGLAMLRLYFLVFPIFVYAIPTAKRWCERIALPVPDIQVVFLSILVYFLNGNVYAFFVYRHGLHDKMNWGEMQEFILEFIIFFFSIRYLKSAKEEWTSTSG